MVIDAFTEEFVSPIRRLCGRNELAVLSPIFFLGGGGNWKYIVEMYVFRLQRNFWQCC